MSSSFGGGGSGGTIRYVITVDDSGAIQKLQGISEQTKVMTESVQNSSTAVKEAEQSNRSYGPSLAQVGTSIAFAASSVISLIQQYTSLKRAQNTLERAQNTEKTQVQQITKLRDKYNEAVKKHGKNSKEAKDALDKLNLAEQKHSTQVEKIGIMQESYNNRLMSFAFSVVPSVIGVVSGLAQTFDILGVGRGGMGGIKGVLGWITKLAGPFIIIGGLAFAIKTNFLGFRDALDAVGNAIGKMFPGLKPLLDAIRNIGIVIGLVPGNADEANKALKKFGGNVIEWAKGIQTSVLNVINKLKVGDIKGAIDEIKLSIHNIASHIIIDGTPLDQLPTRIKNHFTDAMAKHKGDILSATADVLVFLGNIFFSPVTGGTTGKQYGFGDAVRLGIQKRIDESKGDPVDLAIKFNDFFNLQIEPFDPVGDMTQGWADSFHAQIVQPLVNTWYNVMLPNLKSNFEGSIVLFNKATDLFKTLNNFGTEVTKWITDNIVAPILTAWEKITKTFTALLGKNGIFSGITVESILGSISLEVQKIISWITNNIISPILNAWAKISNTFTATISTNGLFDGFTADKLLGSIPGLIEGAIKWFTDNVINPLIEGVKGLFGGGGDKNTSHTVFGDTGEDGSSSSSLGFDPTSAQKLQTALANLSNEGIKSIDALANAAFSQSLRINKGFSGSEVAAQKLQTGIANLSNQGSKSFSKIEVAAQKLQTGLANLSNEGIKSVSKLATAIGKSMAKIVSDVRYAQRAVISLINSIGNLHSKSITITTNFVNNGSPSGPHAEGGVFYADKPTSAGIFGEAGPELAMFMPLKKNLNSNINIGSSGSSTSGSSGTTIINLRIDGNDIINERTLSRRIREGVGQNMDKFG